jgi:hypothetical protein
MRIQFGTIMAKADLGEMLQTHPHERPNSNLLQKGKGWWSEWGFDEWAHSN